MKIKKTMTFFTLLIACNMILGGGTMAEQETVKLTKPQISPNKAFLQSIKTTFQSDRWTITIYKELSSDEEGSVIYYSLDGDNPKDDGDIYQQPVQLDISARERKGAILRAVNTKDGYEDSDISQWAFYRMGMTTRTLITQYVKGVSRNRRVVNGTIAKDIYTKKYKMARYITLMRQKKNGKEEQYEVKVKKGKWSVKLKSKIKKDEKLFISAMTKKCLIRFNTASNNDVYVITLVPSWKAKTFVFNGKKLKEKK